MMRPSPCVRIHSLVVPNAVIRYAQRHCGSHSLWSQFSQQRSQNRRVGATIGMSHLRHKRAEDLRAECVAILSHHIPLSRSIHQDACAFSLAFESARSRISKCAGLNQLIASHHQHHQKLRHTKQLDPSHHSQHHQKDYYVS